LQTYQYLYESMPDRVVADAGYGNVEAYVKYNTFDKEHKNYKTKKKASGKDDFHRDSLHYNEKEDYYVCPMGQRMEKQYDKKLKTKSGYLQYTSVYQAQNCNGCPLRSLCHKSAHHRTIQRNHRLQRHKEIARQRLNSELGEQKRVQRTADVEPVFAHIKSNRNFKRFTHKGIKKAELEFGLHALAHNLKKKVA